MLRIIIRIDDAGMAVNVGGAVHTAYKTFDVDLPEVEKFLTANIGSYAQAQVTGVEAIEPKQP